MAELKCTAKVLECRKIQDRIEQLQLKRESTGEEWGIFVTANATDDQVKEGSFYVCESEDPPVGLIEIWNTADGELI